MSLGLRPTSARRSSSFADLTGQTWSERTTDVLKGLKKATPSEIVHKLRETYPLLSRKIQNLEHVVQSILRTYPQFSETSQEVVSSSGDSEPVWKLNSQVPLPRTQLTFPYPDRRRILRPIEWERASKLALGLKKLTNPQNFERVLDFRGTPDEREYLVKYRGLSILQAVWHSAEELKGHQDLLDQFYDPHPVPVNLPLRVVFEETNDKKYAERVIDRERSRRMWDTVDSRWEKAESGKTIDIPRIAIVPLVDPDIPDFVMPQAYIAEGDGKKHTPTNQPPVNAVIKVEPEETTDDPQPPGTPSSAKRKEPEDTGIRVHQLSKLAKIEPKFEPNDIEAQDLFPGSTFDAESWAFPAGSDSSMSSLPFESNYNETPLENLFAVH